MPHFTNDTLPNDMSTFYKKPVPVQAKQILEPFTVLSLEGIVNGKAGDYLMIGVNGEPYINDRGIFEKTYVKTQPVVYGIYGESWVDSDTSLYHEWLASIALDYDTAVKERDMLNAKAQEVLVYLDDSNQETLVENFCDVVQMLRKFDRNVEFNGISSSVDVTYSCRPIPLV